MYKSGLELKFMRYCDRNPMVLKWNYEGLSIKYLDKSSKPEKVRNYHIDFVIWVRTKDGPRKIWVEVKQQSEVDKPVNENDVRSNKLWLKNQCKWRQAKVTALQNNAEFRIITEAQLDGKGK